jgi:tripartite ATP-independent transporter DctP family solute receptor
MISRRRLPFTIATILALGLFGTAIQANEFRSSDVHSFDYPTVQAVAHMDGLIRARTGGRHGIYILGQNDKDSEGFTVAQLRNGSLDMARVNLAALNNAVPSTIVPTLPFLFKSTEHMRRVLDGPIGEEILADLAHHGLIGLCFYDTGARSFYSAKRPIQNAADMIGLKVRVQPSDKLEAVVRALGAEPIALPFNRVHKSFQGGMIDTATDNWPSYVTSRHYEVAKYYSMTEHSMAPGVLVFSKMVWDTLSNADQEIIRAAAKESVPFMRKQWDQYQTSERNALEAAGTQIITDVDKKSFSDALTPLYSTLVPELRLQAMVKRIRSEERPKEY